MIIQFSVKNYKSFRDKAKLNFLASRYDKDLENNLVEIPQFQLKVVKSTVFYGANAAGKSKLMDAMSFMRHFMLRSSADMQSKDKISIVPFRLNPASEQSPSEFEIIFLHEGELFRYGFEVTQEKVVSEWLFHRPKTKEIELFFRDEQNFEAVHSKLFRIGARLVKDGMVRQNALLLSVAAQFNDPLALRIFEWLSKFNVISGLQEEGYEGFTIGRVMNNDGKNVILDFLNAADLGINDVKILKIEQESDLPDARPGRLKELLIQKMRENDGHILGGMKTLHHKYDVNGNQVGTAEFEMEEESSGTQKYFALSGPIIETLQSGDTLVVDELESKLHPNLVAKIVELFQSPKTNPHNAQLIFNTHDINLLSSGFLRRDQIWFVQKDRYGASSVYSLADFKTDQVRKEDNFEKNYVNGKYGAVPYLEDFEEALTAAVQ
jgi:hypothetical protein